MKHTRIGLAVIAAVAYSLTAHSQSDEDFQRAAAFGATGDALAMEEAYAAILQSEPTNVRALTGRATARSWQGNRAGARADFAKALEIEPNNLAALVGLGYDFAWGGDYKEATASFERALSVAPDALGAQKGLAFAALWDDRPKDALMQFESISSEHPDDIEAQRGIAQAHLALGRSGRAEAAFRSVLSANPEDPGAQDGLRAARSLPALLEASAWVGNGAKGSDFGLRAAELGSWVTPDTRIGVRYDNSLSLDNPALARQDIDAEAWFLSAQTTLADRVIAVAEIGRRDLPGSVNQDIYKLEGVLLDGERSYKLGAQHSPTDAGYDDQLIYFGAGFPISDNIRLDTTAFASRTGIAEDEEIRGALFGEYTSAERWTLGAGFGWGDISSDVPEASGTVTTANITASMPIKDRHSFYVQARWEDAPLSEFSSVMAGFTIRLPRP